MSDLLICGCVCLALGLWLGFLLCMILTFGSQKKWNACGDTYQSGRVSVLHELYELIAQRQKKAHGAEWSTLNEVLDLIAEMLPREEG